VEFLMTEHALAIAVVRRWYPPRRWAVVLNAYDGISLPYEADIFACSKGGRTHEVEVKVSLADLKRDAQKRKWRAYGGSWADAFWYAVPVALEPAATERAIAVGAGLYVVEVVSTERGKRKRIRRPMCPRPRKRVEQPYVEGRLRRRDLRTRIWRLTALRYWNDLFREG
jgi:hypothetical protein